MFLTTEPSIQRAGRDYTALRVIFGVGTRTESSTSDSKMSQAYSIAIGHALMVLEREASELGADGVIGVHLSISEYAAGYHAIVMGTAIKFQQP